MSFSLITIEMNERERQLLLKELDRQDNMARLFIIVYIVAIIIVNIPLIIEVFNWICK